MAGDFLHWQFQYTRKPTDIDWSATGASGNLLACKDTDHQLAIQSIAVSPVTYATGTWTFREKDNTGAILGTIVWPAAAPTGATPLSQFGTMKFDFGPTGRVMASGAALFLGISATGPAAYIHLEAYERAKTGVISVNSSPNPTGKGTSSGA